MTRRREQHYHSNGRLSNWRPDACQRSHAINSGGDHCGTAKACAGSIFRLVLAIGHFEVNMPSEKKQLTRIH